MLDMDNLSGLGIMQHHVDVTSDILPEVCHQIANTVPEKCAGESFLFPHRDTLLRNQLRIGMFCFTDCLRLIARGNSGIIGLALL